MLLDEVVLEQQRLGLGIGDRDLDARDVPDQRLHLRIDVAREEVIADAVAQAARLAHVQQFGFPSSSARIHAVHARPARQVRDVFPGIELVGVLAHAHHYKPASVAAR